MAPRAPTYSDLAAAFRHGNFKPLYMLHGEERYFIDSLQDILLEHALQPHEKDFNLDIVYGAEAHARDVLSMCAAFPMMAERRVVIVRDFDMLTENVLFQSYAKNPNPAAVVLLVCRGKPNMARHPYRAIRENGVVAQFKALRDYKIPRWIEQLAKEKGISIDNRAAQMLATYVGESLSVASSELDKLATFVGDREVLTADDVVHGSGQTREFNVFELQKAVGELRHADTIRITERLLQQSPNKRGEATKIVAVLTSFFVKLWHLTGCQYEGLTEKEMAGRVGVSPYFLKDYLFCLPRFNGSAFIIAFSSLLTADYELKGGSTRSERLVLNLMFRKIFGAAA